MPYLSFHPAPGVGDLLPGWFVVPQNPIKPVTMQQNMGDFLPAQFAVPQNPINNNAILKTLAVGVNTAAMGCASCQYRAANLNGMGGLGLGDLGYFTSFDPTTWGMAEWATIGIGAFILFGAFRPSGSEYQKAVAAAKAQYRDAVTKAKTRYPRVYSRVRRGVQAATS